MRGVAARGATVLSAAARRFVSGSILAATTAACVFVSSWMDLLYTFCSFILFSFPSSQTRLRKKVRLAEPDLVLCKTYFLLSENARTSMAGGSIICEPQVRLGKPDLLRIVSPPQSLGTRIGASGLYRVLTLGPSLFRLFLGPRTLGRLKTGPKLFCRKDFFPRR